MFGERENLENYAKREMVFIHFMVFYKGNLLFLILQALWDRRA